MTIRSVLTDRHLTGERRRDAIIAAYCDEIEAEYIERDEDTAQAAQPDYGPASHEATIEARYADPRQHESNQVCLADMMLITGRVDHAEWMRLLWPALPEVAY